MKKVVEDTAFEKAVRNFWEKYYESHKKNCLMRHVFDTDIYIEKQTADKFARSAFFQ